MMKTNQRQRLMLEILADAAVLVVVVIAVLWVVPLLAGW